MLVPCRNGRVSRWSYLVALVGAGACAVLPSRSYAVSSDGVFLPTRFVPLQSLLDGNSLTSPVPSEEDGVSKQIRQAVRVRDLCERVDVLYRKMSWRNSPCLDIAWTFDTTSEKGEPLLYWVFEGEGKAEHEQDTTLVFGGVHGDEYTAAFAVMKFAWELHEKRVRLTPGQRVVLAPLVNPDGFLRGKRNNANGVDLNRNFPTSDWWTGAHAVWKSRRHGSPLHFPGNAPRTEEGTRFQMALLERFQPDKVISVHSPLDFIDYDGPGDSKKSGFSEGERQAHEIAYLMARRSGNTRVADYRFFPGSLGNFAGNERSVPTITVEFGSSMPGQAEKYWKRFAPALRAAVEFKLQRSSLARAESARD